MYDWIWRQKAQGQSWQRYLRRACKKRRKRQESPERRRRIAGRVGIEQRPAIVEKRKRLGDWESDRVEGSGSTAGLASHVERNSRYTVPPRAADGGPLLLDEVGELGAHEQAMLLRAVEEKRFLPVGADEEAESSFQLICGSNRDLHSAVASGAFREDLLGRINVWTFHLPSLPERPEDIEPNLDYELDQFALAAGLRVALNPEARQRFMDFAVSPQAAWPGNFRDLNGAVVRMGGCPSVVGG